MKKLAVIFSIILSLLIVRGVFAENILQDNFIINRITKLIRLSTYFNQFLIGDTATSTDYVLEVHDDIWADDSMRANQFCINTTTPDCITAWPSGATAAYPINQWLDTTNTPTFVGLNASSTNVDSLVIYNGITLGGVYRNTWPAASGSSAGSWWATSSNNLIGYPDLAGDYSIVIGAAATTSEVKFEVNGSAKIGTNLIVGTELLAPAARLTVLNSTTTNIDNLTVYSSVSLPNNSITDAMVADTITASNYLSLVNWFATTTHANIASLPSLSITESQISDLSHYTDADTGNYIDASSTIQTYFSYANLANSWGDHSLAGYLTYPVASSVYLSLTDWFSTTTHANISSLPSLSITESQISDLSHYTDADTGDYIDASTTIQTYFSNAATAFSWGNHATAGYLTSITNLFDQWLDTTNTPTFAGINASTTNAGDLMVYGNATTTGDVDFTDIDNVYFNGFEGIKFFDDVYLGRSSTSTRITFAVGSMTVNNGELINASTTRLAVLNATTTGVDLLTAYTSLAVATTTPWSGYELAVTGDGVFTGNLKVLGGADFNSATTTGTAFFGSYASSTVGFYTQGDLWAGDDVFVMSQLAVATTTPWDGYELAVAGDGVFTGNLYVMGNATSSHFAASEICLNGSCRTSWPTDAAASSFWQYNAGLGKAISPTSTDIGLFVTASSTVAANFRVDGQTIITGHLYAGTNLYVGQASKGDNDFIYFDAGAEYLVWNNTSDLFVLSNDLSVTGYATTTAGLFTQGNLRVGGNATTTGSHEFTTKDGAHGLRIIPGSTTTTLDFF